MKNPEIEKYAGLKCPGCGSTSRSYDLVGKTYSDSCGVLIPLSNLIDGTKPKKYEGPEDNPEVVYLKRPE